MLGGCTQQKHTHDCRQQLFTDLQNHQIIMTHNYFIHVNYSA